MYSKPTSQNHFKNQLISLVVLISLVLFFAVFFYYQHEKNLAQRDKYNELHAIAKLKTNQLSQWRKERLSEASFFSTSIPYTLYAKRIIGGSLDDETYMRNALMRIMSNNRYKNIFMLTRDGRVCFSVYPGFADLDSATMAQANDVFLSREIKIWDFHFCETHQEINFEIFAPIVENNRVVALMVFLIDPADYLYPLIQEWPTPSKTAETIIVRKVGDLVFYMNKLHHLDNSKLQVSIPITETSIPAVQAVLGKTGLYEGVDYIGHQVLSDISKVSDSPWYIIVKVDNSELYANLNKMTILLGIIVLLGIILDCALMAWFYYNRQRNIYRELLIQSSDLHQSQEEFEKTLYSIGDGVITTDEKGQIKQLNPMAEKLTGWEEKDAKGKKIDDVFRIVDEKTREKVESPVSEALCEGTKASLTNRAILISRDGKEFPINNSGAPIKDKNGRMSGVVMVFSDQTEENLRRKLIETRLNLFEFAIDHSLSEFLTKALDDIGEFTKSPIGFFHFLKPDQETILFQNWSTLTEKEFCKADGTKLHHNVSEAGVWADCIREGKPVIHNDYENLTNKKGLPEGHSRVIREFVVPVFRNNQIVAVLGMGNKQTEYNDIDIETATYLADVAWEVADDKRREENLRQSEERFNHLFERAPLGYQSLDEKGCFIEVNQAWTDTLGYSRDEVIGKWFGDFLEPEYVDLFRERFPKFIEMGSVHSEFEMKHKNGERRFIAFDGRIGYKSKGIFEKTHCILQDITDSRKIEGILRESEDKYRTLVTQMQLGLALFEIIPDDKGNPVDYRFLDVNPSYEKLTGIKRDYVIGKTVLEVIPDNDRMWIEKYGEVALSGEPVYFETYSKESDKYFSIIAYKYREHEFAVILENITQRKRDENIQQILYEIVRSSMSTNVIEELLKVVRLELNRVIDTTNFFVALYNPENETLRKVIFFDEKSEVKEWKVQDSLSGKILKTGETLLLNKDEGIRFAAANGINLTGIPAECWLGVPLIDNQGIIGVMVVQSYTDPKAYDANSSRLMEMIAHELSLVFQRKKMIQDLILAKEKAEESDLLKSAFLANLSHEIRTPMNGILGFMELLGEPDLNDDKKEMYLDIMNKSGQRLLETINNIVEISRIESGQIDIHLSEVNISEVMEFHHVFFKQQSDEKGLGLKLTGYISGERAKIMTDKHKLDGILTNLIKNAIKFTKIGGIEFGNYLEGDSIVFFIKDTGMGIPNEKIDAVFDRFVQADLNISRPYEGSGLGLSIVKAYIEALKGKIWVNSEVDKGSMFSFSIPYIPVKIEKVPIERPEAPVVEIKKAQKILVAEDDEAGYVFLETILEKLGYTVLRTINGEDTVRIVQENPDISLILMDLKMLVMDGLEATRQIRKFNKAVPIIAQTAYAILDDKKKSIEAGCNDYISKPIESKVLFEMIRKYTS